MAEAEGFSWLTGSPGKASLQNRPTSLPLEQAFLPPPGLQEATLFCQRWFSEEEPQFCVSLGKWVAQSCGS